MSRSDRKSKRKSRGQSETTEESATAQPAAEMADDGAVVVAAPVVTQTEAPAAETSDAAVMPMNDAPAATDITSDAAITVRDVPAELAPADAEWPARNWPLAAGPRGQGFQVIIRRSVLNGINRHGQTNTEVEICGVLAGNVYRDDAGPYLRIEAGVRGEHSGNSSAQVTFTAETWNHIQGVMEKDHADLRVVGWYHTHPGFGIFLSDMDLFIHGNFFNLPWQVALVYDPISGEEGLFIWRNGKTERVPFFVEEDVEKEIVTIPVSAELTAAALADFSRRMQGMEKRQKNLLVGLAFLVLIALGWPFVLYTIMSERPRETRIPVAAKSTNETDGANHPVVPTTSTAATLPAVGPTTEPVVATTQPAATQPVAEVVHPLVPSTTQAVRPDNSTASNHVEILQPAKTDDKPEVVPSVIRPNPATGKGPRVLEGPDSPPKNP